MRKALSEPWSILQMHWVTAFKENALWQRHNIKPAVHVGACLRCHETQTTDRLSCLFLSHTNTLCEFWQNRLFNKLGQEKKKKTTAHWKSGKMETLWLSFGSHSWSVESLNKEQADLNEDGADGHLRGDSLRWINISLHTNVLGGNNLMYFWWDQITGCHGCPLCFCWFNPCSLTWDPLSI